MFFLNYRRFDVFIRCYKGYITKQKFVATNWLEHNEYRITLFTYPVPILSAINCLSTLYFLCFLLHNIVLFKNIVFNFSWSLYPPLFLKNLILLYIFFF